MQKQPFFWNDCINHTLVLIIVDGSRNWHHNQNCASIP